MSQLKRNFKLEQGLVDPLPLIDARFPLQQGAETLRQAAGPGG
ncbi:MAG: hypothetical protein WAK57_02975 [Desulfobacterales bacterium]